MTPAQTPELLPCPFCADPMRHDERSGLIRHLHDGEDNRCPIVDLAFTDLERWNTRAAASSSAEMARLVEAGVMSCRCPKVDWFNVTVWTLISLYCLAVLGLAGLGAAYLAGWLP